MDIDFLSSHEEAFFMIELHDNHDTEKWRKDLETRDDNYLKERIDLFVSKRGVNAKLKALRWNVGTLLVLACEHASMTIVQYLIETYNANINACNGANTTSLMKAIENNRLDVAQYLLHQGASPEGCLDLIKDLPESNERLNLMNLIQASGVVQNAISHARIPT